jgi:hypothetical protein
MQLVNIFYEIVRQCLTFQGMIGGHMGQQQQLPQQQQQNSQQQQTNNIGSNYMQQQQVLSYS